MNEMKNIAGAAKLKAKAGGQASGAPTWAWLALLEGTLEVNALIVILQTSAVRS